MIGELHPAVAQLIDVGRRRGWLSYEELNNTLPDEMVDQVRTPNPKDSHDRSERERLFFEAMMRVADRELPGYRD